MKFRNPWIDPRVLLIKAADAEAYLLSRGWTPAKSGHPNKHAFANSAAEKTASMVQVAQLEQASDFPQRMIELIGDLAIIEDRWAADVVSDILQAKKVTGDGNGSAARGVERAAS